MVFSFLKKIHFLCIVYIHICTGSHRDQKSLELELKGMKPCLMGAGNSGQAHTLLMDELYFQPQFWYVLICLLVGKHTCRESVREQPVTVVFSWHHVRPRRLNSGSELLHGRCLYLLIHLTVPSNYTFNEQQSLYLLNTVQIFTIKHSLTSHSCSEWKSKSKLHTFRQNTCPVYTQNTIC